MIVKKTSVFPASPETVYEKIRKTETLWQIAAPCVSFEPAGEERGIWEDASTSSWRLRLTGVIPLGIHRIHIVRFGPGGISSREDGLCLAPGQTCSMYADRGNGSGRRRRRKWTTKRNRKRISTGIPELF